MVDYISECFDDEITSSAFAFPKGTPVYMKDGYTLEKYSWQDNAFIMITPKDSSVRLPTLKKHYRQIADLIGMPCAMDLEWMTPLQRNSLIHDKIPFVSGRNQIYLPFWGCVFREKYKQQKTVSKKMTPTTQLVFLWTYYAVRNKKRVNLTAVVSELGVPKTSVSRAFSDLVEYGLVIQVKDGTAKWIDFAGELPVVLNKAMERLVSPISGKIYLKNIPNDIDHQIGGLCAIPAISTNSRDGSIVFSKEAAGVIPSEYLIPKREFEDFGGVAAEVWKYDPHLLSSDKTVDDISLLLSLRDCEDERIQKELDDIKTKYGLDV